MSLLQHGGFLAPLDAALAKPDALARERADREADPALCTLDRQTVDVPEDYIDFDEPPKRDDIAKVKDRDLFDDRYEYNAAVDRAYARDLAKWKSGSVSWVLEGIYYNEARLMDAGVVGGAFKATVEREVERRNAEHERVLE